MILLFLAKFGLVRQADGFLKDVGLDLQFLGHGLDGITEATVESLDFVHDLHAFVDDLCEFGFLFCGKITVVQYILLCRMFGSSKQ